MKFLQLNKISDDGIKSLQPSFSDLPETSHKDGKYRLRRYSVIELRTTFWNATREAEITHLSHRDFIQGEEFNKFQGGMARSFEDIEEDVLQSQGMKEACLLFKESNNLVDGQEVEIHQMRIITLNKRKTPVSPEGIHQDGFDHIAMLGVNRYNVSGGELTVHKDKEADPLMTHALCNGEIIMLDDSKLWHNANPIEPRLTNEEGHMDLFVFCTLTNK